MVGRWRCDIPTPLARGRDRFELERLIGDRCISINEMNGGALQGKLSDLCNRLEAAEKYDDAMLEEI